MKVKTFYDNGHFDIFDTDSLTESVFRRTVATNYSFDLKERDRLELWLTIYYHETADEYKEDIGPVGVPVSHRRDGWFVLLADSRDMAHLRRVSVDGETVLVRIEGELVDVQALEYAADIASYYTPRIVGAYDYYLKALGREDSPAVDEEICSLLSVPSHVVQELLIRQEMTSL